MFRVYKLKTGQALAAVALGEFGPDVAGSAPRVAVVMSQDWCPQWLSMYRWLADLESEETAEAINVFTCVYNREAYFQDFLHLKEKTWNNYHIPYIRFYRNGTLTCETNYIEKARFIELCLS